MRMTKIWTSCPRCQDLHVKGADSKQRDPVEEITRETTTATLSSKPRTASTSSQCRSQHASPTPHSNNGGTIQDRSIALTSNKPKAPLPPTASIMPPLLKYSQTATRPVSSFSKEGSSRRIRSLVLHPQPQCQPEATPPNIAISTTPTMKLDSSPMSPCHRQPQHNQSQHQQLHKSTPPITTSTVQTISKQQEEHNHPAMLLHHTEHSIPEPPDHHSPAPPPVPQHFTSSINHLPARIVPSTCSFPYCCGTCREQSLPPSGGIPARHRVQEHAFHWNCGIPQSPGAGPRTSSKYKFCRT